MSDDSESDDVAVMYRLSERAVLAGHAVAVDIEVRGSWCAYVNFALGMRLYTFRLHRWSRWRLGSFMVLLHEHSVRDAGVFGAVSSDGTIIATAAQRLACVRQGCVDVLQCVDAILRVHGRGVLDYAVWYREHHLMERTYVDFITNLACHCIARSQLTAPGAVWSLVTFADAK